jgi:p-hydroxybenzoate 3-monooxygenase
MDVDVAIIGAGPAGLVLSHLLEQNGVTTVVLEARSRSYIEARVRAGVLEYPTVKLLRESGLADRLERESMIHTGVELRFNGECHRIPLDELTGGKYISVYGQQEVVKDLVEARLDQGNPILFDVSNVEIDNHRTSTPSVSCDFNGERLTIRCRAVSGCDGFHGVSRSTIAAAELTQYNRVYPFSWLGILARVAPSTEELIYAQHHRGFALHSMRSPDVSRFYLQVEPDEDPDDWSDDRIWSELQSRLETNDGWTIQTGPLMEKSVTPMRSFVVEPMQYGRLFLAGDAAHIVPPTGAKGLNLAVNDARILAYALTELIRHKNESRALNYTRDCLWRVWRAQHFSWWMTSMLHKIGDDPFQHQLQVSELTQVTSSTAAATVLAENYVGFDYSHDVSTAGV